MFTQSVSMSEGKVVHRAHESVHNSSTSDVSRLLVTTKLNPEGFHPVWFAKTPQIWEVLESDLIPYVKTQDVKTNWEDLSSYIALSVLDCLEMDSRESRIWSLVTKKKKTRSRKRCECTSRETNRNKPLCFKILHRLERLC